MEYIDHPYLWFTPLDYCEGFAVGAPLGEDFNGFDDNGANLENALLDYVPEVQIPRYYDNMEVVEIGNAAFARTEIERIFIPNTIRRIGVVAFFECYYLQEIRFDYDSQLEIIGGGAFAVCESLEIIDLPSSLMVIGEYDGIFLFVDSPNLVCLSYLGFANFSQVKMFDYQPENVFISSEYSQTFYDIIFGQYYITGGDEVCGVSNDPFDEDELSIMYPIARPKRTRVKKTICTFIHRREAISPLLVLIHIIFASY